MAPLDLTVALKLATVAPDPTIAPEPSTAVEPSVDDAAPASTIRDHDDDESTLSASAGGGRDRVGSGRAPLGNSAPPSRSACASESTTAAGPRLREDEDVLGPEPTGLRGM